MAGGLCSLKQYWQTAGIDIPIPMNCSRFCDRSTINGGGFRRNSRNSKRLNSLCRETAVGFPSQFSFHYETQDTESPMLAVCGWVPCRPAISISRLHQKCIPCNCGD